jgi:putative ABC transport system substrate-binding protein
VYQVGVVYQGGSYLPAIDGLRDGLKQLKLEEGKHFVLHLRDTRGELKAVEAAASSLEAEKVDLICTLATSVTLAAKRATTRVPIVFYAGTDPVSVGLVENFRKPGGRLTGIHGHATDLTAKRLELLQAMVPRLRRAVAFYNPENVAAQESLRIGRAAASQLKVQIVERPVTSVEALRAGLQAIKPGEFDAYLNISDAMMISQSALVIEATRAKKLPAIFPDRESVAKGALASYGLSYHAVGRLLAKPIQRILAGADPGDLPVEQLDRLHFVINLKTAKALGLSIPQSVLGRADEVIE